MKVVIFQHTDGEHPGAFTDLIAEAGDTASVIRLHRGERIPNLSNFDAMIVLGGPMDVWETRALPWLTAEKATIATWVKAMRKPFLGICLGHQLLVDTLGGICESMPHPEIGVSDIRLTPEGQADPIFSAMPASFPVLQWHGVEATTLPPNAVLLAQNDACQVQAFRVGDVAWGVQFHPELTSDLVKGWMLDAENRACAIDWLGSAAKANEFAQDCEAHVETARVQSRALYNALRAAVQRAAE